MGSECTAWLIFLKATFKYLSWLGNFFNGHGSNDDSAYSQSLLHTCPLTGYCMSLFQITNLVHSSFILQKYVCYITILNMFRALPCSSSGGKIVLLEPLVSSLSVNSRTVCRLRADCSPLSTGILCISYNTCVLYDARWETHQTVWVIQLRKKISKLTDRVAIVGNHSFVKNTILCSDAWASFNVA